MITECKCVFYRGGLFDWNIGEIVQKTEVTVNRIPFLCKVQYLQKQFLQGL